MGGHRVGHHRGHDPPLSAHPSLGGARREPTTTHAGRRVPAGVAYATAMPLAASRTDGGHGRFRRRGRSSRDWSRPRGGGPVPYLRLATNRNYALLWCGQLVSLMGDRIHQVALGYLVVTRATPWTWG